MCKGVQDSHLMDLSSQYVMRNALGYNGSFVPNIMAKVSGIPGYKFNPRGIMCNDAGCNFNAIKKVYGQEFLGQTVTCQFHFKNCAKNHIKNINIHEQETFKSLCEKLCST